MARTNIGAKVAIATQSDGTTPDPQNDDLEASGFGGLSYTDLENVVSVGDTGVDQNMVTTQLWDKNLADQNKGAATGRSSDIVILDEQNDGRTALDAAAAITDDNAYALRITYSDASIEYNRMKIGAPALSKGGNEDVAQATYPAVSVQEPVTA